MEIERHAIGLFDPGEQRAEHGRACRRRRRRHRHETETLFAAKSGEGRKIIDRAGGDGAGGAGDHEGLATGGAVPGDGFTEGGQIDAVIAIDRDHAERMGPEAGLIHRARQAAMGGVRGVGGEFVGADAGLADVTAEEIGAGDGDGDEVGHRAAGDQNAGGFGRHADHLGGPGHHLAFDQHGGVIAAADVGVEAGGDHFGQHSHHIAAAMDPAHEARVGVAGDVSDQAFDVLIDFSGFGGCERERKVQRIAHFGGHFTPGGDVAEIAQVIDHIVHHAMAEGADLLPISGIEIPMAGPVCNFQGG